MRTVRERALTVGQALSPALGVSALDCNQMRLRTAQNKLKIEHSIIGGLRDVLERLLAETPRVRSVIPGVIRQVRDARGKIKVRVTVPTTNGWKAIALSAGARQELFISTDLGKEELEAAIERACNG